MHVGFIVNVNGGHSDGWKTAKLQVVRHEAVVNTHSGKMVQANKCESGIFSVEKKRKKKNSQRNDMFHLSLNYICHFFCHY